MVFGVAGLVGGGISFFLPETLGHPLPDTVSEAAHCANHPSKGLWVWWSKQRLHQEVDKNKDLYAQEGLIG